MVALHAILVLMARSLILVALYALFALVSLKVVRKVLPNP